MELTKGQSSLIEMLSHLALKKTFYWTGGTLLAVYYLHHRLSLDLDFFSDQPFSYNDLRPFLEEITKKNPSVKIQEHKIYDRWEFIINNGEQLKIEFVYYNHEKKRLNPLKSYLGVAIDSLEDIAANKVMAYFDRNEPKDLVDLYFLITIKKLSVPYLLQLVKKKFDANFSEFMFWSESTKSLTLLNNLQPLFLGKTKKDKDALIEKISQFFLQKGSDFLRNRLE